MSSISQKPSPSVVLGRSVGWTVFMGAVKWLHAQRALAAITNSATRWRHDPVGGFFSRGSKWCAGDGEGAEMIF